MPGPEFGYVAPADVLPLDGRIIHKLGMAVYLWLFLRSFQTSARGDVFWEQAINIDWIFARIPNSPPKTTLRLWLASLRLNGFITAVDVPGGLKIVVVDPVHWPSEKQLRSKKLISIDEIRLTDEDLKER